MDFARPGDPLVANSGELIEANARKEPSYSLTIPIARTLTAKTPRSVREMSTDAQTQTVINAVLMYKLLGVSVNETAHILGTTIREIEGIMSMVAFQETFEMLFRELLSASSNSIQARIQSYAGRALDNIIDLADAKPVKVQSEDDAGNTFEHMHYDVPPLVILKANQDVLDRSGMNAEQLYGKDAEQEAQQLEIVVRSDSDQRTDVRVNIKTGGR